MEDSDEELEKRVRRHMTKTRLVLSFFTKSEAATAFHLAASRGLVGVASQELLGQLELPIEKTSLEASAQAEVDSGFHSLSAYVLLSICAALETLAHDFLKICIRDDPSLLKKEIASKLKLAMTDLLTLGEDEKADLLATKILDEMAAPHKLGIERFHDVYEAVGFSFPVREEWRRPIREMYGVRNVILHRGGTVDRRLLTQCPWVAWELGSTVKLTSTDLIRYTGASSAYVRGLMSVLLDRIMPDITEAERRVEFQRRDKEQREQEWERQRLEQEAKRERKRKRKPRKGTADA